MSSSSKHPVIYRCYESCRALGKADALVRFLDGHKRGLPLSTSTELAPRFAGAVVARDSSDDVRARLERLEDGLRDVQLGQTHAEQRAGKLDRDIREARKQSVAGVRTAVEMIARENAKSKIELAKDLSKRDENLGDRLTDIRSHSEETRRLVAKTGGEALHGLAKDVADHVAEMREELDGRLASIQRHSEETRSLVAKTGGEALHGLAKDVADHVAEMREELDGRLADTQKHSEETRRMLRESSTKNHGLHEKNSNRLDMLHHAMVVGSGTLDALSDVVETTVSSVESARLSHQKLDNKMSNMLRRAASSASSGNVGPAISVAGAARPQSETKDGVMAELQVLEGGLQGKDAPEVRRQLRELRNQLRDDKLLPHEAIELSRNIQNSCSGRASRDESTTVATVAQDSNERDTIE